MRYELGFPALTPQVTTFLIIIIASYLAFAVFGDSQWGVKIYHALMLAPDKVFTHFQLWRLMSYGFLHDVSSPLHVIFNALMLYMVGPQLEDRLGEKKFLLLILVAIFMGGIFVCLAYLLGLSYAVVVGFSAATMGLLIAWGLIFQNASLYVFGILPLSGLQLVYVSIGIEILYALSSSNISSAAHFGGMFAGFIFAFELYKLASFKKAWRRLTKKRI
jgi:membrane associated rhomboid family serine protease